MTQQTQTTIEQLQTQLALKEQTIQQLQLTIQQLQLTIQQLKANKETPTVAQTQPINGETKMQLDKPEPEPPFLPYNSLTPNFIENSKICVGQEGVVTIWFDPQSNGLTPKTGVLIVGEFTGYIPLSMSELNHRYYINWKFSDFPSKNKFIFLVDDTKTTSKQYDLSKSFSQSKYPMNYIIAYQKTDPLKPIDIMRTISDKNKSVNDEQRELFSCLLKMNEGVKLIQGIRSRDILISTADLNIMYEVIEKTPSYFVCRMLTDNNGLLLANSNKTVQVSTQELEAGLYLLLGKEEVDIFCMNLNERQLSIQYMVENNECVPFKLNKQINLDQYDVQMKNNEISKIVNPNYGEVKFKGTQMEQITAYVKSFPIKIYYSIINNEIFNLIHIHFNEQSLQTAIDLVYLKPGETEYNHKEFKKDALGNTLNYRIIVKDNKIHTMLFNTGKSIDKINFEGIEIKEGLLYTSLQLEGKIMRITNIPNGLLAAQDPAKIQSFQRTKETNEIILLCSYRHPEEYEGLVDVNVVYSKGLLPSPMPASIPVCDLKLATKEYNNLVEEQMNLRNAQMESVIFCKIDELKECLLQNYKAMNDEEKAQLFKKVSGAGIALNNMLQENASDKNTKETIEKLLEEGTKLEKQLLPSYRIAMHSSNKLK